MVGYSSEVGIACNTDAGQEKQIVLLVGDVPDELASLCRWLNGIDVNVVPVSAGEPLEPFVSKREIAMVLLAHAQQARNISLARELRLRPHLRNIPLVFITSILQESSLQDQAPLHAVTDFLLRPIHPVLLRSKVKVLLELAHNRDCLACLQNVSRSLRHQLQHQVVTDMLTGLLNRHGFLQALENELARAQRTSKMLGVMHIDLDSFKRINEAFGHHAGDDVLRTVAARIRQVLRPYDQIAHLGSDEFAILAEGVGSEDQVAHIAEKILNQLALPHTINGLKITLNASVGIAVSPDSGTSPDALMRAAGLALQRAKAEDHHCYRFFSVEMNGRARARLLLEQSLRHAIDAQEFELYFQPQMHVGTGCLRGFEALLRWQHVTAGLIEPSVFVPVLEEAGFIQLLGPWIIDATCRQIALWQDRLPPGGCVSLNLSPMQFAHRDLVESVAQALATHNIPPHQLELEVTESMLVTDIEHTRQVLRQLRELGVKTAIDDFGTGYSSMAYLRQFEVDTLKIDKMFISGLPLSARDTAIAQSITQLGHNLGMEIIAEGVETAAQLDALRAIGCDIVQGYYFARPEPATAASGLFRAA